MNESVIQGHHEYSSISDEDVYLFMNSDGKEYWGSGTGNSGKVSADLIPFHARAGSLRLTLPPLAIDFFEPELLGIRNQESGYEG
jgi:hypothetical protein